MSLPQETIRRKRDGETLTDAEIADFAAGLADGRIGEGQAAAFAMAVFFRGLTRAECAGLTRAMTRSGEVIDWSGARLSGPVLDKHSTGGVGDTVSLVLAPLVAACGGFVPMISGRGLGHTGGTLDKLEAIPGYDTAPSPARFAEAVRAAGCAIIGQTGDLAPADKRLYAVRDVTATVESVPLITASILSKKLAAGLDALVLDVKAGAGAFMASDAAARELAESLVAVANEAGLRTAALLTDMDAPLAPVAGNALETRAAIDLLAGRADLPRLREASLALAARMLRLGGLAGSDADARATLQAALEDGRAAERFQAMVRALGGPSDLVERPDAHLAAAPVRLPVFAHGEGYVRAIAVRDLGLAVVALGGGRVRAEDAIDPSVGLSDLAGIGAPVSPSRPLALVHARDEETAAAAARAVRAAYALGEAPAEPRPLVLAEITG